MAGKKINKVKIVVSGAGSAALACANLYVLLGVNPENIIMFDKEGVLHKDRSDLSELQRRYASGKIGTTMAAALKKADVFLGLSAGNILTPDMLLGMAKNPIVFAMANPDPEITPEEAMAEIMSKVGFGSSDYGNSFDDFEHGWMSAITPQTTVIVLGDARSNNLDPRADIVQIGRAHV